MTNGGSLSVMSGLGPAARLKAGHQRNLSGDDGE
jgi:hypothetical protein